MDRLEKINIGGKFANFFGALGYLSCSLQWLWTIVLYFSWLKALVVIVSPTNNQVVKTPAPVVFEPNIVLTIVAGIIFAAMIALTIYFFYKIPATIIRIGKKSVQRAANSVAPIVLQAQHKKETKRNLIKLTPKITIILKLIIIITPLVLTFTSYLIEKQMIEYSVALFAGIWLACSGIVFFVVQYIIASLLSVKRQNLW